MGSRLARVTLHLLWCMVKSGPVFCSLGKNKKTMDLGSARKSPGLFSIQVSSFRDGKSLLDILQVWLRDTCVSDHVLLCAIYGSDFF